ncbi:MAG TPA: DUF3810 domain-containing protein, partial [Myxococcota bacterium]|nr:DUF3810 domain-containing protein [Myxococcota bacterium]
MDDERWPADRALDPWSTVRITLFCGGTLSLLAGWSADPVWVEQRYVDGWGVAVASTLARVTAWAPFSVGEVMLVALVAAEIWWLLDAASEVGAGRRRARNAALGGILHATDLAMVLLAAFYVAWGVSYARPPALERLALVEPTLDDDGHRERLARLTEAAIAHTRDAYRAVHGSDDAGAPTLPRAGLDVDAAIDRGFAQAARSLSLPDSFAASRGHTKQPLGSELMSWFGVGGIYWPYTGEANVNGGPPAFSRLMTAAHEMSHQRMVASEDEASFYGFLACVHADEAVLRYAGWEFGARQLLRALAKVDRARADALSATLPPGVRRDEEEMYAYWDRYEGWLEELGRWTNDHYLKANRVPGGVAAYGRAGRLVAAWMERSDPSLL